MRVSSAADEAVRDMMRVCKDAMRECRKAPLLEGLVAARRRQLAALARVSLVLAYSLGSSVSTAHPDAMHIDSARPLEKIQYCLDQREKGNGLTFGEVFLEELELLFSVFNYWILNPMP